MACGGLHTLVVAQPPGTCAPLQLVAFGGNDSGQLGCGDTTDRHSPVVVATPGILIQSVAAGRLHSIVVAHASASATASALYGMGGNDDGQLGLPIREAGTPVVYDTPTPIALPEELASSGIELVCCGATHTLVLDARYNGWSAGAATQAAAPMLLRQGHGEGRARFARVEDSGPMERAIAGDGWTAYIKQRTNRTDRVHFKTAGGLRRVDTRRVDAFANTSIRPEFTRLVLPDAAGYSQAGVLLTSHWGSDFVPVVPPKPEGVELKVAIDSQPSSVVTRNGDGTITATSFIIAGSSNLGLTTLTCPTAGVTLQQDTLMQRKVRSTGQWHWKIEATVQPLELSPCEAGPLTAQLAASARLPSGDEGTQALHFLVVVRFDPSMTRHIRLLMSKVAREDASLMILSQEATVHVTLTCATHGGDLQLPKLALCARGVTLGCASAAPATTGGGALWHATFTVDVPDESVPDLHLSRHRLHVKVLEWAAKDGARSNGPTLGTTVTVAASTPPPPWLFVLNERHTHFDIIPAPIGGSVVAVAQNECLLRGAALEVEDARQTTAAATDVLEMTVTCPHAPPELNLVTVEAWLRPEPAGTGGSDWLGLKASAEPSSDASPGGGSSYVLRWTVGSRAEGWAAGLLCATVHVTGILGTVQSQQLHHQPPYILVDQPRYHAWLFAFREQASTADGDQPRPDMTKGAVWTGSTLALVVQTDRRIVQPSHQQKTRWRNKGAIAFGDASGGLDSPSTSSVTSAEAKTAAPSPRRHVLRRFKLEQSNTVDVSCHPFRNAPTYRRHDGWTAAQYAGEAGATIDADLKGNVDAFPYQHLFMLTLSKAGLVPGRPGVRLPLSDEHGQVFVVSRVDNDDDVRLAPVPPMAVGVQQRVWGCGSYERYQSHVSQRYAERGTTAPQMVRCLRQYVAESCDVPTDFPWDWVTSISHWAVITNTSQLARHKAPLERHEELLMPPGQGGKLLDFFGSTWRDAREQDVLIRDDWDKKRAAVVEVTVKPKASAARPSSGGCTHRSPAVVLALQVQGFTIIAAAWSAVDLALDWQVWRDLDQVGAWVGCPAVLVINRHGRHHAVLSRTRREPAGSGVAGWALGTLLFAMAANFLAALSFVVGQGRNSAAFSAWPHKIEGHTAMVSAPRWLCMAMASC